MFKFSRKKIAFLSLLIVATVFVFLFPKFAGAIPSPKDMAIRGFGWIVVQLVDLFGKLLLVIVHLLISVAQYNDFMNSPAVTTGWVIIRDLVNMFFVVILLIIAWDNFKN